MHLKSHISCLTRQSVQHLLLIGLVSLCALGSCYYIHAAESVAARDQTTTVPPSDRLGEMVTIPAGSFLMGNNGHEGYEGPEEFPQHSVNLPAYQIGKCEVTRGEFRRFIEAGGYTNSSYWSTEGWKWKESDETHRV
jgi:formylglycine-generating enzyme required for sulfatase activity